MRADDALARKKGFKNYYQYRNYLAQQQGYKNYNEQRKARKAARAGDPTGLRGLDKPRFGAIKKPVNTADLRKLVKPALTGAEGRLVAWSFDRPRLDSHIDDFAKVYDRILKVGQYEDDFGPMGKIVEKNNQGMLRVLRETVDSDLGPNNFVGKVYRQGLVDAGVPDKQIKDIMRGIGNNPNLVELQEDLSSRVSGWSVYMKRKAEAFDKNFWNYETLPGHKGKGAQRERKKFLKRFKIMAHRDHLGGEWSPETAQRFSYQAVISRIWNEGFFDGYKYRQQASGKEVFFQIYDGPGCGLETHDDPVKANGLVVSYDQARQFPMAHPYCVRKFIEIKKPGGRERKEAKELEKMLASGLEKRLTEGVKAQKEVGGQAKTALLVGAAAGILGIATTEITGQFFSGTQAGARFRGTVGDWVLNFVMERALIFMQRMQELQARVLSILSVDSEMRAINIRLKQAATDLRTQFSEYTQEQAEVFLAEQIHAEQFAWEMTGENVTSLASRRVIRKGDQLAQASKRVVGDDWEAWDRYYRLRFYASDRLEGGISELASLFEDQNIFVQGLLNRIRPISGKYGRLSLPRINVREGTDRATHRYGRLTLHPNDLTHLHVSARPSRDGTLRTVTNLRVNPNGLLRFGFVMDDRGVISPNFSIVPKGPLRIYSKVNRSPAKVRRRERLGPWVGQVSADSPTAVYRYYMVDNPAKGRVNSITTEITLLARWTQFIDSFSYKFRLNMRALGIYKLDDIRKINYTKLRFMLADDDWFTFVSKGVDLRLRGFGLFDIQRSLRIDERRAHLINAGLRNADNDLRLLMDLYISGIEQAKGGLTRSGLKTVKFRNLEKRIQGASSFEELETLLQERDLTERFSTFKAFVETHRGIIEALNDSELFEEATSRINEAKATILKQRIEAARKAGVPVETIDNVPPADMASWQLARWVFDLTQHEIEARVENFTDYLIIQRRESARPKGPHIGTTFRVPDPDEPKYFKEIFVTSTPQAEEELMLKRPNLILAFLEADPVKIARDLQMKLLDVTATRERLYTTAQRLFDNHIRFVPTAKREAILKRLEEGRPGSTVFFRDGEIDNVAGSLRWHRQFTGEIDVEEGKTYTAKKLGTPELFESFEGSIAALEGVGEEIVEYVIDGESVQRMKKGVIRLNGNYTVTGITRMERGGDVYDFPTTIPEGVNVVHRVYLRQLGTEIDYRPLAVALNDTRSQGGIEHYSTYLALRKAHPDIVDSASRFWAGIETPWDRSQLREVARQSPIYDKYLYRTVQLSEEQITQLGRSAKFFDSMSLYTTDTKQLGDVVIAAKGVRGFNISPMTPLGADTSMYLVNGEFAVEEIRTVTDGATGRSRTYIFVRWLRQTET